MGGKSKRAARPARVPGPVRNGRPVTKAERVVLETELQVLGQLENRMASLQNEIGVQRGRIQAIMAATGGEGLSLDANDDKQWRWVPTPPDGKSPAQLAVVPGKPEKKKKADKEPAAPIADQATGAD